MRHLIALPAALCLAVLVPSDGIRAQTRVEVGVGPSIFAQRGGSPSGGYPTQGTVRVSIGEETASQLSWRFDGVASLFDHQKLYYPPCPSNGCGGPSYLHETNSVVGVEANALLTFDSRKRFYLLAGTGIYNASITAAEQHIGVSAGAGVALPAGARMRVVIDAHWTALLGGGSAPASIAPITVGLRF